MEKYVTCRRRILVWRFIRLNQNPILQHAVGTFGQYSNPGGGLHRYVYRSPRVCLDDSLGCTTNRAAIASDSRHNDANDVHLDPCATCLRIRLIHYLRSYLPRNLCTKKVHAWRNSAGILTLEPLTSIHEVQGNLIYFVFWEIMKSLGHYWFSVSHELEHRSRILPTHPWKCTKHPCPLTTTNSIVMSNTSFKNVYTQQRVYRPCQQRGGEPA